MSDTPRVLIAGCGYVGTALARRLTADGAMAWGLRRDPSAIPALTAAGAVPLIADLTQPATLRGLPEVDWVVACQSPGRRADRYRPVYVDGTRHLLDALAPHPPQRLLWISSTGVYGQSRGEWVDEATPPAPSTESGRILLEAEAAALHGPCPSMVLRLAGIYGPGRTAVERLRERPELMRAHEYLNHIRLEDIVEAVVAVLRRGEPGQRYIGVDDEPVLKPVFYRWLAARAGVPVPAADPIPEGLPGGKRCRNVKLAALGWRPTFSTYRAGYADLVPSTTAA
jgi:nucleoside-diphosphate-sugar epimerase